MQNRKERSIKIINVKCILVIKHFCPFRYLKLDMNFIYTSTNYLNIKEAGCAYVCVHDCRYVLICLEIWYVDVKLYFY